ncbi:NUDIX hydrolase [Blastococcus sp. HT6-30]|uniref:NUDIX hydrolase n=1 Tax=Blastococcus sp. HT6-30 TaxID=3144843 RepID=UPI00321ACB39
MPADRMELVERYLRGETDVVEPRDAASVVLLRDGAAGPEVYLLRRRPAMAFAAGMHVFPGGSVDLRDREAAQHWAGPPPAEWAEAFSCDPELAAALVAAAVRETFEESGVLLAAYRNGTLVADTTGEEWERDRLALIEGELALSDFLRARDLLLRADLLRPWAHWITPEWQSRRFDTRFFLAALPAGQRTRDVGGEADRVAWLPVAEAYRGFRDRSLTMMNATASTLRDLTAHPDVASAMAASRRIRLILGHPVLTDGRLEYLYDGDDGPVPLSELVEPLAAPGVDPGARPSESR